MTVSASVPGTVVWQSNGDSTVLILRDMLAATYSGTVDANSTGATYFLNYDGKTYPW